MTTTPAAPPPTETRTNPSLRRVLAGYLRVRSPYNLCIDSGLVILASYVLMSGRRWLSIGVVRSPPEQFSAWWAMNEAAEIGVGMLYLAGMGLFVVGCARIIADRVGPAK